MKKIILFITVLSIFSCNKIDSIEVNELECKDEIIVRPYSESDSAIVMIPHLFEVNNKSFSKIWVDIYSIKRGIVGEQFTKNLETDGVEYFDPKDGKIGRFGKKKFQMYFSYHLSKKELDSSYWYHKKIYTTGFLLTSKKQRISSNSETYNRIIGNFKNDSVRVSIRSEKFSIVKTGKIYENKFRNTFYDWELIFSKPPPKKS
jgi:hypothetical protein